MVRAVLERGRLLTGALVGLAAYLAVVGAGVFGIVGLTGKSAETAMHVADAISSAIDQGAEASDMPRALRAAASDYAAPITPESQSFVHARAAPPELERLNADELTEIKNSVSERIVGDDAQPWHTGEHQTYKTMCVRLCDGAYFPISFATTREHFARDEAVCASRCGSPARLFAFPNPGGSPDTMRDRAGHSYLALPTAFQFRKGAVSGCSCQAKPWELASRERHRLYALEQDVASGRPVDMAELSRLRSSVTFAAAEKTPANQSVSPIETAALAPRTAADAGPLEQKQKQPIAPSASLAPPSDMTGRNVPGSGPTRPVATEIAATHPFPATFDTSPTEAAAVDESTPPLPVKSRIEARTSRDHDIEASLDSRSRKSSRRSSDNRRSASRQAARPPAASKMVPGVLADREVWGVGRNAHGGPRGGSALETFARNFY